MLACGLRRQEVTATDVGCPPTCTSCGEQADELLFRRYRRVVGMVILDTIHQASGNLCPHCRTRLFRRHMG
jgi:hypothetical protein